MRDWTPPRSEPSRGYDRVNEGSPRVARDPDFGPGRSTRELTHFIQKRTKTHPNPFVPLEGDNRKAHNAPAGDEAETMTKISGGHRMNTAKAAWRSLATATAGAMLLTAVGCLGRNDDINRVQPGYVTKAIFEQDSEWYYNRTLVKSDVTNAIAWEGMSVSMGLERIKWRVEENHLFAYRAHEALPGSEFENYEGTIGFEGSAIGVWPITSHFDIRRGYEALSGQETNIIDENTEDRPWHERDYMRVDWSENLIEKSDWAGSSPGWIVNAISTGKQWTNLQTKPTDPFAARFSSDYIEVTEQAFLAMDIYTCAEFTGFASSGYQNCGYGEAMLRHSFKRIAEESDFIPREFPDSVVRTGPDGEEITDPVTGEVLREPVFDRFGYFRSERLTYDRGYGTTESGRLYRAQLFNIWERHTDDAGRVLPEAQRTPKPIIYYTNYDYPERWRQAANAVAADYNQVYTEMVADLQGISVDQFRAKYGADFKMYDIRQNDCNVANVRSFVSSNPDLLFAVERAVCNNGTACPADPLTMVGVGNLAEVCTSLEAATVREDGTSEFEWQRLGDVRYSFVAYLPTAQMSPWGGYGPNHPDPLTGEIISATAWIRGFYYEMGAANVLDVLDLMNDKKTIDEIVHGQDIRRQITESQKRAATMRSQKASPELVQRISNRMGELGQTKDDLLREVDPNWQMNRMKRINGTRPEQEHLKSQEFEKLFAGPSWGQDNNALPEQFKNDVEYMATMEGRVQMGNPMSPRRMDALRKLSSAGYCFLQQDVDPYYESLAEFVKDMPRDEAYNFIVDGMIRHVMAHELGHNVGLRHNFESSYDSLNYYPEFWRYFSSGDEEKKANHWDVRRVSSVMEYAPSKGRIFADHLGPYDVAAIRFGYANQVHVFGDASIQGGRDLYRWRMLNDYTKLPEHLCPGCSAEEQTNKILDRRWVSFDPQNPPANEVPYAFCSDEYAYGTPTPFCQTGDFGSNVREIFADMYVSWSGYFPFNNFARERLSPAAWSPTNALIPAIRAMGYTTRVGQWLYYYSALDNSFLETDLGQDMVTTIAQGLNMAAEVISTPEPIRFCLNQGVFMPYFFFNGCDQYAPLNSAYATDAEMIQVPLGDGRPVSLGLSDDFVDWQWNFIGSYFDKENVLLYLGLFRPTFFRFNYELDVRTYYLSLFRLFEPELRKFYENIITTNTNLLYFSDIVGVAESVGSYWCRDENDPTIAALGHYEPRRLIDPELGTSLPGPTSNCVNPAPIYPQILSNLPFSAMFYAHALFSNPFDTELDMGKSLKVFVLGSDDEPVDWRALPAAEICSVTDRWTGLEYRAIRQPGEIAHLGCMLIEKAQEAQTLWEQQQDSDFLHRVWREWFEKLEYSRDLSRVFDR